MCAETVDRLSREREREQNDQCIDAAPHRSIQLDSLHIYKELRGLQSIIDDVGGDQSRSRSFSNAITHIHIYHWQIYADVT